MPARLLVVAMLMGDYGAFIFSLTLHIQGELGLSALRSGLGFSPCAAGFAPRREACGSDAAPLPRIRWIT